MNIEQVQQEVATWSLANFGDQKGINHIAPALGLVEELGELEDAILEENHELINDSVGDIGIYFCDITARLEIPITDVWVLDQGPYLSRTVLVGKIIHCILKNHQGIRGFKDEEFFKKQLKENLQLFVATINRNWDITRLTIETWQEVKDRNWKKNATTGGT